MMNVPLTDGAPEGMQAGSLLVNVHVPQTTPLVNVPVVLIVPFEVPLTPPAGNPFVAFVVSCRALLLVWELTEKLRLPVTWPAEFVLSVALPLQFTAISPRVTSKHGPEL